MSQVSIIDIEGNNPQIPTQFNADVGFSIPIGNVLEILAETVLAGIVPIETVASGNTVTVQAQISQAIAVSNANNIGLAAFNLSDFSVDAAGFVSILGEFVSSVSGTANRITSTGGTTPIIDIAASYVGQTSITTLGTVTIGTWNGTTIGAIFGGTGITSYTTGDTLYASAANTLSKLAVGSNGQVLTLAAGIPSWATPTVGTVTSVSGTANRITSTGGATPVIDISAAYIGQTSLTTLGTVATGTWNASVVSEVYGGTDQSSYTTGDILYSSSANNLSKLAIGSAGQVLTIAAGIPSWATPTVGVVTSITGGPGITITGTAAVPIVNSVVFTDTAATTLAVDSGYNATAAGTYALPATAVQGELIILFCDTAGAVILDAPALNFIRIGSLITSSGGTATSTSIGDSLTLRYRLSSLTWECTSCIGTWIIA